MIEHLVRLDADVLSIEASRSGMDILDAFDRRSYPNEIGPDCGLKTRRWEEVVPALEHLVEAARRQRAAGASA